MVLNLFRFFFLSIGSYFMLSVPYVFAQDNNLDNFTIALLQVEKAHVVESVYYLTSALPKQCNSPFINDAASEFANNNSELIKLVNESSLLPMVKDKADKINNPSSKPSSQISKECAQTYAALKSFESEAGRQNAVKMLQTMKKQIIIKTE